MKKINRIVLGLVLFAVTLSGCSIGSGKTEIVKPTLGQELMELKNGDKLRWIVFNDGRVHIQKVK